MSKRKWFGLAGIVAAVAGAIGLVKSRIKGERRQDQQETPEVAASAEPTPADGTDGQGEEE